MKNSQRDALSPNLILLSRFLDFDFFSLPDFFGHVCEQNCVKTEKTTAKIANVILSVKIAPGIFGIFWG